MLGAGRPKRRNLLRFLGAEVRAGTSSGVTSPGTLAGLTDGVRSGDGFRMPFSFFSPGFGVMGANSHRFIFQNATRVDTLRFFWNRNSDDVTLRVRAYTDSTFTTSCLLYTSPSPRDQRGSRMPSSA